MNSLGHFVISILKSVLRIGSCAASIVTVNWMWAVAGIGIAEFLGILEELVDKRK